MNSLEKDMIETLKILKNEYGVFEIKCEFEAEGSRMEELMRLKDVTSRVGLPLIMKIGGVEAITDIYNALALGVNSIVAPMAETAFALSKYISAIENMVAPDNAKDIDWCFNLETITGFENFDKMLALPNIGKIDSITVGRVDFTGSLGKKRDYVDSDEMYDICHEIFVKARKAKMRTALGGAISTESLVFVSRLHAENLLDKFETRKVVYKAEAVKYGAKAILKGIDFELQWLKSKRRYYSGIKTEDEKRIAILEKRLHV